MDDNQVRELNSSVEKNIADWTKETELRLPKEFISSEIQDESDLTD
jgi:hypothetical protein